MIEKNNIRSVLIPFSNSHLLLPAAMVAEIIPYQQLLSPEGAPAWFLGLLPWRERKIPLILLEAMAKLPVAPDDESHIPRIVVCYSLNKDYPFYAIKTCSTPRSLRISGEMLTQAKQVTDHCGIAASVQLEQESVWMPSQETIQQYLRQVV
ncbi:chemotaxis protein CheW [Candidatus Venteria ishoeyi]|uniref:CheW-like domain protein n=1 Tax=Candidatus Venteria ishoeyi TaxID=1899563 RepID=A0A1H6FEP3_9GAMM|nr:chemotaxis protein CheW [Candidatus Venteria ishoeyi]MDM8545731.1 chemotaxis protein CheW [Candidatus Venteria ishoeyi]SEH07636.1 CheW-like domain protein [Candidatus Venteria ishoeyi]